MKQRVFFTILFLWLIFPAILHAKVWINEFMQSNINFVIDDLQEFPDSWIELYNDTDEEVAIQNWTISNDDVYKNGWIITDSVIIYPKSYLLIYADKVAWGLHANFRLESGNGGVIYLFDESRNVIDSVINIPRQPAPNIARARITDGDSTWAYFVSATPGETNTGNTSKIILPPPVFSQLGGIFKNDVILQFSLHPETPAEIELSNIHYTLDNSEPTIYSPVYTEELIISNTTVVRAKLIHPDYLTDMSTVHTYIISNNDLSLPVISISIDSTYLWDEEFGIYCEGNGKFGVIGNCVDYPVNWNNNWRRPINFEYFPLGSKSNILNQLCEMRIAGSCSRTNLQKSFIVYGNKRFGINRFYYDFFKEKPNQEIKSFLIRNSGNDFCITHFRDAAIQLFMGGKVDVDYQAYQPAILFLNGNYWGIQNLRERSDEDFVLANYATEDIDMFENWWDLKAGDRVALNKLMGELYKTTSEPDYQWISDQIDIEEFINYMILQIYVSNTDFPQSNIVMWRPRHANGKWRFLLKDLDFGLGLRDVNPVTHNALKYNTGTNSTAHRHLFNALLTQDSFRQEFYSRFAIYMGDILHYDFTSQIIDSIQMLIEPAMPDHLVRWMPEIERDANMNVWRSEVSKMKNWCKERNAEVYNHLQDFFNLGKIMQLTFEMPDNITEIPAIYINGIRIRDSGLKASYFQNETIELHYDGNDLHYGWEITQTVNGKTSVRTYFQRGLSYPIVEGCTSIAITLINDIDSRNSHIEDSPRISLFASDSRLYVFDIQHPSVISIYDMNGRIVSKKIVTDHSTIIPFNQKGVFIVIVENKTQRIVKKIRNR